MLIADIPGADIATFLGGTLTHERIEGKRLVL